MHVKEGMMFWKAAVRTGTWTRCIGGEGQGLFAAAKRKPHLNQSQICPGFEFPSSN